MLDSFCSRLFHAVLITYDGGKPDFKSINGFVNIDYFRSEFWLKLFFYDIKLFAEVNLKIAKTCFTNAT